MATREYNKLVSEAVAEIPPCLQVLIDQLPEDEREAAAWHAAAWVRAARRESAHLARAIDYPGDPAVVGQIAYRVARRVFEMAMLAIQSAGCDDYREETEEDEHRKAIIDSSY